jgi:hypothetical protein
VIHVGNKKQKKRGQQKERRQTMGSMKDQLIDAPCHSCGRIATLQYVGTITRKNPETWKTSLESYLLCDLCMCEEAEHQQETVRKEGK